jgi:hypothetical protein
MCNEAGKDGLKHVGGGVFVEADRRTMAKTISALCARTSASQAAPSLAPAARNEGGIVLIGKSVHAAPQPELRRIAPVACPFRGQQTSAVGFDIQSVRQINLPGAPNKSGSSMIAE